MTKHGPANYPIWSIVKNGAVWGNRHRSAEDTIAEVEQMLARDKEAEARCPKYDSGWISYLVEWDDEGRNTWTKRVPMTITIEAGSTVYYQGPVIAKWVGGERVL
jgi:hypothetical protein